MAKEDRTEVFDVPLEKFYQAIIEFKNNPKFLEGVKWVDISNESAEGATVKMNISLIKEISYTIKLTHLPNERVSWSLVTGDMMKLNNGRWTLKSLGPKKTEVTYSLEVELKGFMPGLSIIEKTLVNTNLPLNLQTFGTKAESL